MLSIDINKENAHVVIGAKNPAEVITEIGMAMRTIYRALKEKEPDWANEVKNILGTLGVTVFMEDKPVDALVKKCLEALVDRLEDDDEDDEE